MDWRGVSSEALVAHLVRLRSIERRVVVKMLWGLVEVHERRLHLEMGFSSLFMFCREHLGLPKGTAWRRSTAAELLGRFPLAGEYLADGRVSLGVFALLRDELKGDGVELLDRVSGMSEDDVRWLFGFQLEPPVGNSVGRCGEGHVLRLSVSQEFADDLAWAQAALSHQIPDRDIEKVLHAGLRALRANVEKKRRGVGPGRGGKTDGRYVPVDERRPVWDRDGESCAFVSADGRRCGSTYQLELHHQRAFAKGGQATADNLGVVCRAHNQFLGEQEFGPR